MRAMASSSTAFRGPCRRRTRSIGILKEKGLTLDAVIELKVDEGVLLKRIKKRIAEMKARREALREDDDPEVLHRRLLAYRDQTAPLVAYYQLQSVLCSVDGMVAISGGVERD